LVQRGHLSKHRTGARRPDQDLHDALADLRESGRIPWDWIIDETRSVEDYTGYPGIKQGVLAQLPYVKLDPWNGDPPFFLTESRSLAGVLRPVIVGYCARIASTNGQCGSFPRTGIAPLLKPGSRVEYLGDYDLAGNQIEDNTQRVLEQVIPWETAMEAAGADRGSGQKTQVAAHHQNRPPLQRMADRTRRSKPKRSVSGY
jgi:hypothetical protein